MMMVKQKLLRSPRRNPRDRGDGEKKKKEREEEGGTEQPQKQWIAETRKQANNDDLLREI